LQKIQAEVRNCVSDIINNIDNEESTIIPCKQLGEIPEKCIRRQSVSCFSAREIDFKDKFSSEIFLELRNLVEMSETKSLVAKIENNDWKFMHFFASCVLGAGTNTSITLNPSISPFQFCVIVVIKYFISHLK